MEKQIIFKRYLAMPNNLQNEKIVVVFPSQEIKSVEIKIDKSKILNKCEILDFAKEMQMILFPNVFDCECSFADHSKKAKELYIDNIDKDWDSFNKQIDKLKEELFEDIKFTFDGDPAANGYEEIILTYPGFLATTYYRIAHIIYGLGNKIAARIISEQAHFLTGIDINPGAKIGVPFFIDHGTGIVIGETAIVGNNVKIYQGVTLGAMSLSKGQALKNTKRHPTIGNNVTIYAGASILGDIIIGDNVIIGSNVFLTKSISANHKVTLEEPKLNVINKK